VIKLLIRREFFYYGGGYAVQSVIVSLKRLVGGGYKDFWIFKGRYRIVKGSRASKKSKTAALWYITHMMTLVGANTLVVRKSYKSLRGSAFTELKWAIRVLKVEHLWHITENPLEMTYKPTGQKIYFRGLDDPLKITSITVENGHLCWLWIEEAYELMDEEAFNTLDESIRGAVPDHLFKQITLTLNPWSDRHWIKKRFCDISTNADVLSKTTNYMCNEFLDDADIKVFEEMKINNPRRYRVAGLGEWGVTDGLVYDNWREENFDINQLIGNKNIKSVFGLDFGYTNDPTGLFCGLIDIGNKKLYVFDEMYKYGMSNEAIAEKVIKMGYAKESIVADSAEPKSIDRLRDIGLVNIKGARKGKDSVNNGIDFLQGFEIIVHPDCINFLVEISSYTWEEDRHGKKINRPISYNNHLMDAMRYGIEQYIKGDIFSFD
jgi:phage terminase large subunit